MTTITTNSNTFTRKRSQSTTHSIGQPRRPSGSRPQASAVEQVANQGIDVRVATTPEELDAIYRFRYRVYVQEMGREERYADHAAQRIDSPDLRSPKALMHDVLSHSPDPSPADSPAVELAWLVIAWQFLSPATRSAIRLLIEADQRASSEHAGRDG